jgi:KaiC/GvpD/RAD55 family RecA-like ATPase
MNPELPFIPPATAKKLAEPVPKGHRHEAALKIAISLVGNGLSPTAVFQTLRDKFDPDVTDRELENIVQFAVSKQPTPSGYGTCSAEPRQQFIKPNTTAPKAKAKTPKEHADWWLSGATKTVEEFTSLSQIEIPVKERDALVLAFELLYNGSDNINIVCAFELDGSKANPKGPGRILSRDKWVEYIRDKGIPNSKAGAWVRPNPCKSQGCGHGGAVTDSDILAHRFLLIESDHLPISTQLALFAKLKLPLAAVLLSGGLSVHGWVCVEAATVEEFSEMAKRILAALRPFGIDHANKNPSRLSRLPGAVRTIGASNGGSQKLLWLSPGKAAVTDKDLDAFENSLLIPAVEEKPFRRLIEDAIPRYEELIANRGKLGVPTGFKKFDEVSGGLKPGGYTLIGAGTGVGKSTIALNIVNAALKAKVGVLLFTLEMTREDITDMMFAMNCFVNRNSFNTGEFTNEEVQSIVVASSWMKDLPLWVDDDPAASVEGIRRKVLAMKADNLIGLVVVDYAQLAMPDERIENREQAVAAVALGIRLLSREANLPIILLSQLNDEGRVRESRKLSHEASNVFKMERESGRLDDPNVIVFIDKGRKIPATPLLLHLKAEHCLITERSPVSKDDVPKQKPARKFHRSSTNDP